LHRISALDNVHAAFHIAAMRKRIFAICLLLFVSLTLLAQPAQTNTAIASLAELQSQLSALMNEPRFAAATWGVKIVSLESKKTVFEHDAGKLFSPASNCKLYTMALALDQLGGDYRIKTSLYSTAKPDKRGTLKGDLIVYGRGDPMINTRLNGGDIYRALQPLVAALTNAGVRRISGDLVGDESFIAGSPYGSGWAWDDVNYYYGAEISALTINDNTLRATVQPGSKLGEPCLLSIAPLTSYVVLSNRTQTIAAGGKRTINFYRPGEQNIIYVTGRMPLDATNYSDEVTMHDPAKLFVTFFKEALQRNGIKVGGNIRTVNWLSPRMHRVNDAKWVELGSVESSPMREINREVQKPSQNLYTDLVLAHLGAIAGQRSSNHTTISEATNQTETVIGRISSEDLGVRELETFLKKIGVKRGDVEFEEGSGLSRNNLVTPNATITLLEHMSRHAEAESYRQALPLAGVDGSLRNRMKKTRAEKNVHAKTGTLRWANALSGTTAAGERLAFCLMLNRYQAPDAEHAARNELDKIAVMLAEFNVRTDQQP
jgi:D-alanyl-D-alanine carboxypeptidase/D-alanyl-D-alanine-endopeptidase (penicillin-binding protein 4)